MENTEQTPSWAAPILSKRLSPTEKWALIKEHIGTFVDTYVLVEFDVEKKWREEQEQKEKEKQQQELQQVQMQTGQMFVPGKNHILAFPL